MSQTSATRLYAAFAVAALFTLGATPARAQFSPRPLNDPATGEAYHIEGSASLWFPSADFLGASAQFGIPSTAIDFANDLGLQNKRLVDLSVVLRPTKRNKLRFEFTPMSYEQTATVQRTIIFNGIAYHIGVPVTSAIDWKAYRFIYEYDVASFNRWFAGVILEAKYTDIQVQLQALNDFEFARARAPIPAIGGIGRFYVVPNIAITGELTGFKMPSIKNSSGHYVEFNLYGTLNFTNNVGVQFGYRSLDLGVTVSSSIVNSCPTLSTEGTSACFALKGPYVGVVARY